VRDALVVAGVPAAGVGDVGVAGMAEGAGDRLRMAAQALGWFPVRACCRSSPVSCS